MSVRDGHASPWRHSGELALLLVLASLWGSSYLLIDIALVAFPPMTLIAIRVGLASLFLLAVMRLRRERLPRDGTSWRRLALQSILNSTGAWTVLAWGQQFVDSALASVLNSTSPVFVLLLMSLLPGQANAVGARQLGGAALGLVGVVLIVGVEAFDGLGQRVVAQLAIVLGAVLYAGAAIHGRRLAHLSPLASAAGTMLCASAVLVPLSLWHDEPFALAPSGTAIAAALVLAVLCTGVALLLYFRLLGTLGPAGVASQSYLRAGVGVLLGVAVLGERIAPVVGVGLLLAMIGVIAINGPPRRDATVRQRTKKPPSHS